MEKLLWILLQVKTEIPQTTWATFLTQVVITVSISVILLFVGNLLKPIFTKTDERFKQIDDRINQGEKERDDLRTKISSLKDELTESKTEHLLALNDIKHQYTELMRIFQTVEASNKEEKEYLRKLIDMLQNREK
jgi:F0F1-type ATP synthase membrane subunit b/b'